MIKRGTVILLLMSVGLWAGAQRTSTFENWFSVSLRKKFNDFTLSAEEAWRVREFYLSRQNYTDISLAYKFNKHFETSLGYRLALKKHMFNITEANNRIYLEAQASFKASDIEFAWRSKFQYTQQGREDDIVLGSETYVRNRIKVTYDPGRIDIAAGYEMLVLLGPVQNLINENRFMLETSYKINKHNSISLAYILRNYIQISDPLNVHVLSLDYVYKF